MKVYLGGPLKVPVWRQYIDSIEAEIKSLGLQTWSPFRDAGLLSTEDKQDPEKVRQVLKQDLIAFSHCDVALFLLDDQHAGTALELGYAYCLAKSGYKLALIGLVTHMDGIAHIDSMSRYCLEDAGVIVTSLEDLKIHLIKLRDTK